VVYRCPDPADADPKPSNEAGAFPRTLAVEPEPANIVDAMLTAYLADQDTPCPGCGYNLRGLTGRACPECNQALRLLVGLQEPKLGSWLAGLLGAAAGAGFNGLLSAYAMIMLIGEGFRGRGFFEVFVIYNVAWLAVQGAHVVLWIRLGRIFRRAEQRTKVVLIGVAWGLAVVDLVWFSLIIK
jgi:hypothetical protein